MLSRYEIRRKDSLTIILKLCICVIALFLVGEYMPKWFTQLDEIRPSYNEPVMRVVAHSNTVQDQQLKEQIVRDIEQMDGTNIENEQYIESIQTLLKEKYRQVPVQLKIGDNLLPPKRVQHMLYPQMTSRAVVIEIGAARGENWFCTAFPKVCGKEDRDKVRFKWWEWVKGKGS